MRLNTQKYRAITEEKTILDEEVRKGIGMCKATFSQLISGDLGGVSCEAMEGIAEMLECSVSEISLSDLDEGENMIDWQKDAKKATLTFSQPRMISRIRKLAKERPNDVKIVSDNGNVLYAYVPTVWVRVSPPKNVEFTEEQLKAYSERMKQLRNSPQRNV